MHEYAVIVCPESPLEIGRRVRVLALSKVAYHEPGVVYPRYEAYDPHVVGRVTAVVGKGKSTATFELVNECEINPVKTVHLVVEWIPGVTGMMSAQDECRARTTDARAVHMEKGVSVAVPKAGALCSESRCSKGMWMDMDPWVKIVRFE